MKSRYENIFNNYNIIQRYLDTDLTYSQSSTVKQAVAAMRKEVQTLALQHVLDNQIANDISDTLYWITDKDCFGINKDAYNELTKSVNRLKKQEEA